MYLSKFIKYQNLVLILFSLNIFFWDIHFGSIQLRFFYLLLLIPLIIHFQEVKEIKKKIFIYVTLTLFFFLHLYINNKIDNIFHIKNYLSSIILVLTIFIVWENFESLRRNFKFIIEFFLYIFVLSTFVYYFLYFDIFINSLSVGCSYIGGMFSEKLSFLKGVKRFYLENSHLAMISPAVICYYVFKINLKNLNSIGILRLLFLLSFIVISLHNFSLVFFVGLTLSLISLIILNFKIQFLIRYVIIIIILLFSYFFVLNKDEACNQKISDINKFIIKDQKILVQDTDQSEFKYNLSFAVYLQNFDIALKAIIERPFGFGINNYQISFDKFVSQSRKTHINLEKGQKLNFMDGTNNLFKAVAEFGFFALILYLSIFILSFSKKIPFEIKSFVIPLLVVQTFLRSSGYFNGGYLFCILIFFVFYLKYKDN